MFRGRAAVVILAFAVATVGLSIVAAGLFGDDDFSADSELANLRNQQESNVPEAVIFTCHAGSEYAFNFSVRIDLSDGMYKDEAVLVATSLYEHNMKQTNYEVKLAQAHEDGTWTVYLLWGSVSGGEIENHSHYYNVHVNPTNRTVEYDRCY